jgi:hypothetical protein
MKTNKNKMGQLGFSDETINSLTESQVNTLISKILKEGKKKETKETVTTKTLPAQKVVTVTPDTAKSTGLNIGNVDISMDTSGNVVAKGPLNAGKTKTKGEKVINDGEVSESKKPNPWQICTAQLGKKFKTTKRSEWSPKQTDKYERCVKDVKKSVNEGKNPYEVLLEQKIEKMILNNINAKISKKDFLNLLETKNSETIIRNNMKIGKSMSEDTKTAPAKPTVKPGTKPRPAHPGKNPSPGVQPAPKASEVKEDTKTAPVKPTVKPGTKPRPAHPGKNPNPGTQPAPKAMDKKKDEFMDVISKLLNK